MQLTQRLTKKVTQYKYFRVALLAIIAAMIAVLPVSVSSMPFMGMFGGHGSSGYVGPAFKISAVQNEPGMWAGLRGGWTFERAFSVGVGGYWLLMNIEETNFENTNVGYGGIEFQAFLSSGTPVQVAAQTLIGAGSVGNGVHFGSHAFNTHNAGEDADNFLVVEPGVILLMEANRYVQWEVGVSYLAINGLGFQNMTGRELGGITGVITMRFGGW